MSKLVFGVTRIVPLKQEQVGGVDLVVLVVAEAYDALRKACPGGDLRIHLSVEADSAAEVGAVYEEQTSHAAR